MGIGFGMGFERERRSHGGGCASTTLPALLALALLSQAQPASADWRVYTSADLGYSVSKADADGEVALVPVIPLSGSDDDVSPLLGGAVGIAIPMDELAPIQMPRGWRLPDWDLRAEIEAVGLRSYEFKTEPFAANTGRVLTEVDSWSLMTNLWLDVPLRGLYRPISWTSSRVFGRWRLRSLKSVLGRTTLNLGGGIGVAHLDVTTTEADSRGSAEEYNFAWQVGVGLGYQLTDRVNLSLGYRYIDPGDAKYSIRGNSVPAGSFFEIDPEIHEARASMRVMVWDFASPWR